MDKNYRDAVADGISLLEGKLSLAQFGENFTSGLYESNQIRGMFRLGRSFFGYDIKNASEYLKTGEDQAQEFLARGNEINSAVANSLYHTFVKVSPSGPGESYDRHFEVSEPAAEALWLLSEGLGKHCENFLPDTAYKLYFYPDTPEKNSEGYDSLYRSFARGYGYDKNSGISGMVGEALREQADSIKNNLKKQQEIKDKLAAAKEKLNLPAESVSPAQTAAEPAPKKSSSFISKVYSRLKGQNR